MVVQFHGAAIIHEPVRRQCHESVSQDSGFFEALSRIEAPRTEAFQIREGLRIPPHYSRGPVPGTQNLGCLARKYDRVAKPTRLPFLGGSNMGHPGHSGSEPPRRRPPVSDFVGDEPQRPAHDTGRQGADPTNRVRPPIDGLSQLQEGE